MRTKTPHQINEQARRLMKTLANASWNGREYADAKCNRRFERVFDVSEEYIKNIFNHLGLDERNCDKATSNRIYYLAATPASIYTKQNPQTQPT